MGLLIEHPWRQMSWNKFGIYVLYGALLLLWLALVGEKLNEENTYFLDCLMVNYTKLASSRMMRLYRSLYRFCLSWKILVRSVLCLNRGKSMLKNLNSTQNSFVKYTGVIVLDLFINHSLENKFKNKRNVIFFHFALKCRKEK